ncbi:uncharacterized protein [Argopecten irradians]|uniref:uncharacterized protein n=1 Tax=Argopecten irradians TaxID=31199 RepID=UPI00371A51D5
MFPTSFVILFCLALLSTTASGEGSCEIGNRYGGGWDGVIRHTYRTGDSLEIEGAEIIATINDVTNVYKCKESDEFQMMFLILTSDEAHYNCLGFHHMMDSIVQYTVVTKNGSFKPIKIPDGDDVTLEKLCMNGNMEAVMDIARYLE